MKTKEKTKKRKGVLVTGYRFVKGVVGLGLRAGTGVIKVGVGEVSSISGAVKDDMVDGTVKIKNIFMDRKGQVVPAITKVAGATVGFVHGIMDRGEKLVDKMNDTKMENLSEKKDVKILDKEGNPIKK